MPKVMPRRDWTSIRCLRRCQAVASHPLRKYRSTRALLDSLGLGSKLVLAKSAVFCVTYHARCLAAGLPPIGRYLARTISLTPSGARLLEECGIRGSGIVIVSAHLGDFDVAAATLANMAAKPLCAVVDSSWSPANPYHQMRARAGIMLRFPDTSRGQVLRADLAKGRIVAFMLDRRGPQPHECRFCGRPALISSAPAELAAEAGATLIVATVRREGRRHLVKLDAVGKWPLVKQEVSEATRAAAALVSEAIATAPHEWLIPTDLRELPL